MTVLSTMASWWPATSWPVTFVACSGGFDNILYAFGTGYGISMTLNSGLSIAVAKYRGVPLTYFGLACSGLYAAYGIRLTTFLLRRQNEASYESKFQNMQLKSDMMSFGSRFALVTGVSLAQALYAFPLSIATSKSAAFARPAIRTFGWAGVALAACGLLLEHVADEQKLAAKQRDPKSPVMTGLYAYCRHPNYLGEVFFHCGVFGFGLSGTALQVVACSAVPFGMASVMVNAAARADKEGVHKYKNFPGYSEWAARTPSLFPHLSALHLAA